MDDLKPPVIEACNFGHKYYKECGRIVGCPYCLEKELSYARDDINQLRASLDRQRNDRIFKYFTED